MTATASGERYVGLISGTSMDGVDAVVLEFTGEGLPSVRAALTQPFDDEMRSVLDEVRANPDGFAVSRLGALDARLGDCFAEAALAVIRAAGLKPGAIHAIGSHGQTIVHHAEADPPYTLQIGDAHRIAAQTGITTVADFRRADLAAGGQGAPLAPLLHEAMFRHPDETRMVANLGGIANLTVLEPGAGVLGFDTGPANCLLDLWYRRHHEHARFDHAGRWATSGAVDSTWLDELLGDPYLAQAAPKSTGIEYYSPAWLDERLPAWAEERPADVQATLAEFSAASLAAAIDSAADGANARLLLCGGGVHNDDLLVRLRRRLPATPVASTAEYGLDPDHVEATLFAWLARRRLAGQRVDTRSITGASDRVFSGVIVAP